MINKRDLKLLAIEAGVFPTKQQTQLLRACLLNGPPAKEALESWRRSVDIRAPLKNQAGEPGLPQLYDRLDLGSQRLLSLLYKNCRRQGFDHPIIRELEGYYKYVWYRNNLLRSALSSLITDLKQIDVELIVFKGMLQSEKYYRDLGTRPTTDLDIVILPTDATKVVALLLEKNWKSMFGNPNRISESQIHAHTFKKGPIELDLHIRFSPFSLLKATTNSFWQESVNSEHGYRTLQPAHELFLTMLHAYQWNNIPPIRWVADSRMLIDHFTGSDWNAFGALVASEGFDIHQQMFEYLSSEGFAEPTVPLLNKTPEPEIEQQIIYGLTPQYQNQFAGVRRLYLKISQENGAGIAGSWRALLGHYLYVWNKKSYPQLFIAGAMMLLKKGLRQMMK